MEICEVLGLGVSTLDILSLVDHFPTGDGVQRAGALTLQGGYLSGSSDKGAGLYNQGVLTLTLHRPEKLNAINDRAAAGRAEEFSKRSAI